MEKFFWHKGSSAQLRTKFVFFAVNQYEINLKFKGAFSFKKTITTHEAHQEILSPIKLTNYTVWSTWQKPPNFMNSLFSKTITFQYKNKTTDNLIVQKFIS